MSETKKTDGLKWNRAQGGRTSTAELSPIGLLAWSGNEVTYAEVDINGDGPTLDEAEAVAETKLRETYDALREHFDPVPVLRWTMQCNGCLAEGLFVCEENSPLRAWRLAAMHYGHDVSFRGNGRRERAEVNTIEANCRAAEAALRALGVAFRVEAAR
jgi:hypothetical protein